MTNKRSEGTEACEGASGVETWLLGSLAMDFIYWKLRGSDINDFASDLPNCVFSFLLLLQVFILLCYFHHYLYE